MLKLLAGDPVQEARGRKIVRFYARDVHHFGWSVDPDYRYEGALYRGAIAFVYPSRSEGFGIPPLEALAEVDDHLMEKYLAGEKVSPEEIKAAFEGHNGKEDGP